jgi:hypothetical protein
MASVTEKLAQPRMAKSASMKTTGDGHPRETEQVREPTETMAMNNRMTGSDGARPFEG